MANNKIRLLCNVSILCIVWSMSATRTLIGTEKYHGSRLCFIDYKHVQQEAHKMLHRICYRRLLMPAVASRNKIYVTI